MTGGAPKGGKGRKRQKGLTSQTTFYTEAVKAYR